MQRILGLLAIVVVANGCFRYVPVQTGAVRPNEEVRVLLTDEAALRMAREFGAFTGQLEGQLAPHGPDSLALSVLIAQNYRGTSLANVRQTLALGRGEVVEVRRRQLSTKYTVLATAGVVGGFAFMVHQLTQKENPNILPDDGTTPPPEGFRGWIRIPLGWSP